VAQLFHPQQEVPRLAIPATPAATEAQKLRAPKLSGGVGGSALLKTRLVLEFGGDSPGSHSSTVKAWKAEETVVAEVQGRLSESDVEVVDG